MIAKGDSVVSVSYPHRDFGGGEKTETYTLIGKPANVAAMVSDQVQSWLERGASGPMTLHVTSPYSVIDADKRAET